MGMELLSFVGSVDFLDVGWNVNKRFAFSFCRFSSPSAF